MRLRAAGSRPRGRFYFVFQTTWDAAGARGHRRRRSCTLHGRVDAKMREGRPDPFLTVYEVAHEAGGVSPVFTTSFGHHPSPTTGEITDGYMDCPT